MTLIDDLEFGDVKVLYKIVGVGNIDRAYYFMIINEDRFVGKIVPHKHHQYPLLQIVKTTSGYIYCGLIAGNGIDTCGEILYDESDNDQRLLEHFDSMWDDITDLREYHLSALQSYHEWCTKNNFTG